MLDRAIGVDTPLDEAVKVGFLSFDASIRSNLAVGRPLDLMVMPNEPRRARRSPAGSATTIPISTIFRRAGAICSRTPPRQFPIRPSWPTWTAEAMAADADLRRCAPTASAFPRRRGIPLGPHRAQGARQDLRLARSRRDGRLSLTVKLPVSRDFALVFDFAEPAGYGLGRSGWISCRFGAGGADLDLLKRWIAESYRAVAPKKLAALASR